ncbi:hypothetical protein MMC25_005859 [Agyrium rufum]|nr:hypothetical protein [Agyrium rufum]
MYTSLLTLACATLTAAISFPRSRSLLRPPPLVDEVVATTGNGTFQQYIDHDNPKLGTFSQSYWWNDQYYAGPGSPVVIFTPGEVAAAQYTGYLTNRTLTGQFAKAIGGAVVLVEHRYWGSSSPYDTLTTKNMQYLTLKNSIADFVNFANNIQFPFDPTNSSQAHSAPWVFSGGSYSGALAAWTESTSPGTFWAYTATSAPVEAIYNYWEYFTPIQEGMPTNCSKDTNLVINHVDQVLTTGTDAEKQSLKEMFGLGSVTHGSDFAEVLANGPYLWQSNSFTTGYSGFFQWCDFVEGVAGNENATMPDGNGVGLNKALAGYANWVKEVVVPGYCQGYGYGGGEMDTWCFNSYNTSSHIFTDLSVGNPADRQWLWFLCNEPFAYWQDAAPKGQPSLISRQVTAQYMQRQCGIFFPPEGKYTYGSNAGKTVDDVNAFTKGWELTDTTRLLWVNGQFDPWRTSGVSSQYRPGGPLTSTAKAPVQIIPGGFHCSDLIVSNGAANPGVQAVIDYEIATVKQWVSEYPKK